MSAQSRRHPPLPLNGWKPVIFFGKGDLAAQEQENAESFKSDVKKA